MKILVTGANGFLGYYLVRQLLDAGYHVLATGKGPCRLPFSDTDHFRYATLDFTDTKAVEVLITAYLPDVIIHAGALTKPDECELNRNDAWRVNVAGTQYMLDAAASVNAFFLFLSTDFIFDGRSGMYREEEQGNPVNYYGQTKLEAEDLVRAWEGQWSIVRTVLVYGKPYDSRGNLLTFVKDKLMGGETIRIFDDQVRTPTFVEDLAAGILAIIHKHATGIWHLSGADKRTPYEIAIEVAAMLGLDGSLILKVTENTFSQPAKRPMKTGFNIDKARKLLNFKPTSFAEGLKKSF